MKAAPVFEAGNHRWWVLYDHDERRVIDSNVYVLESNGQSAVLDPGGFEIFPEVLAAVAEVVLPSSIRSAFVSHQDPDIASSLPLWNACNGNIEWHIPSLWEGFIRHYGALDAKFLCIPDEGGSMVVGGRKLEFIPAHYLHASANFHVYDREAKVFFSGDVGAALLPAGHSTWAGRQGPESAKAFDEHIQHAQYFHQRWMPSNRAKKDWIDRVRQLDIDFLCPQHGAIYAGENVQRFLNWFDGLTVGTVFPR
ncbi:MAG TPA: MBL fold metallo-hydrolase [Bryocella sp.]|nr:MBL fold metallo-hydrolase [Bryocella sp.]